jgi:hypothetical protein
MRLKRWTKEVEQRRAREPDTSKECGGDVGGKEKSQGYGWRIGSVGKGGKFEAESVMKLDKGRFRGTVVG